MSKPIQIAVAAVAAGGPEWGMSPSVEIITTVLCDDGRIYQQETGWGVSSQWEEVKGPWLGEATK